MAMKQEASSRNDSNDVIRAILTNIRVPELPYPAGKPAGQNSAMSGLLMF